MGNKKKHEQYFLEKAAEEDTMIRWFEEVCEKAGLAQTETLGCIIQNNYETEYLGKWLGKDIKKMDPVELESLYTSLVPLTSHVDIEPYIKRIADGDSSSLLTRQPITTLSLSSGTTEGRPKYVPFTRFSSQTTLQIFRLAAAYRSRMLPLRNQGRALEFIYSSKQFQTQGGLTVGTATTHYYASEEFKLKQKVTRSYTCSPHEVIFGGDHKQTTYCHLLLGLHFCDQVELVTSTFAYSLVHAFRALEEVWGEIVEDIRSGTVSSTRVTLPKTRKAVQDLLSSPDPCLADKIEERCRALEASHWQQLIPLLWPNAKYVYSIMTGSMLPYLDKLRHYAGEHLPLVAAEYGSTESWIGVNVTPTCPPEKVTFAVIPTFSYFEFIPLYSQNNLSTNNTTSGCDVDYFEAAPVPLSRVKIGQQYEIVLTTFTGLYRYKLGDVVEVAGFYKGTPRLKFICRRKLILSVNIDKNTEMDLQLVVEMACRLLKNNANSNSGGLELVDFTSHANTMTDRHPGHYVIYWEVRGEADDDLLMECCREMDLAFKDHGYIVSRKSGTIGALELKLVGQGTFKKILDYYIANGAALSQFKTPRCTDNISLLRILDRCTLRNFFSTAYVCGLTHNIN